MNDQPESKQVNELRIDLEPYQFAELRPLVERFKAEATPDHKAAIFAQVVLLCPGDEWQTPDDAYVRCWYLPPEAAAVIQQALESIKTMIAPVEYKSG